MESANPVGKLSLVSKDFPPQRNLAAMEGKRLVGIRGQLETSTSCLFLCTPHNFSLQLVFCDGFPKKDLGGKMRLITVVFVPEETIKWKIDDVETVKYAVFETRKVY